MSNEHRILIRKVAAMVWSGIFLFPLTVASQNDREFLTDNAAKFYDADRIAGKLERKIGIRGTTVDFAFEKLIQEKYLCGIEFPLNLMELEKPAPEIVCKSEALTSPRCPIAMLTLGVDWNESSVELSGYIPQFRSAKVRFVEGFCPYEPQRPENFLRVHARGESLLNSYLKDKNFLKKTPSIIVNELLADGFMCGHGEEPMNSKATNFVCARWPSRIEGCYEARLQFTAILADEKRHETLLSMSNAKVSSANAICRNPPFFTPPVEPVR